MGNLNSLVAARADGTFDKYMHRQFQRYSTRILDFPGFGRRMINAADAEMARDMTNNVTR